jgi:hypothetical protein
LGWARANLLYDKGPMPAPNTLNEVMCLIVWQRRQAQQAAVQQATVQALVGAKTDAVKTFNTYKDNLFRAKNKERAERMQRALSRIGSMAPIEVTSLLKPKERKMRIVARDP